MSVRTKQGDEFDLSQIIEKIFPNASYVIRQEPGSKKGDGCLGITSSVIVEVDGTQEEHFFVKRASRDGKFRIVVSLEDAFQREIYFYSIVQPVLDEIFLKHNGRPLKVAPRCFLTSAEKFEETLVLENLTSLGYQLIPKLTYFDESHMKMLLNLFSQLHATGFILKQEKPDFFKEISKDMGEIYFRICQVFNWKKYLKFCLNILKEHCLSEEDKVILDNFDTIEDEIINSTYRMDAVEEYPTVIHVDCWLNNIMFKYHNTTKELQDIKMIDFQMCVVNSPIFDILHVFYSNATSREVLENYEYYQDYYYNSLREHIIAMKGDPQVLYPREMFLQQWKKHRYHGLLFAIIGIRGVMTDESTFPDIVELIRQDKADEVFVYSLPNEEDFCQRLKLILHHFVEENLL